MLSFTLLIFRYRIMRFTAGVCFNRFDHLREAICKEKKKEQLGRHPGRDEAKLRNRNARC